MSDKEYGYAILRNMRTCRRLEEGQWVGATWKEESKKPVLLAMVWLTTIMILAYLSF